MPSEIKNIDALVDEVIGREGGYSNHPSDKGGPTRWGVTQAVARKYGYNGDMHVFPREQAVIIYKILYFDHPDFDLIAPLSMRVANELFDTGINMGPVVASQFFQKSLNALNQQGTLYADIAEDGDIGPASVKAFEAYLNTRKNFSEGDKVVVMLRALDGLQTARYIDLGRGRQKNEDFMFGWLRTRIGQA
jgi:lysozyme family protein